MKNQVLFCMKDKSKKLKCRLLQLLFGFLRCKCMAKIGLVSWPSHTVQSS